ncbi:MAG: restriction endonuclease, partial [Gammaproteobacteria bacterium]
EQERTADFQMTKGLLQILTNEGNLDDLIAFMQDKRLPVDDIEARSIADEVIKNPPKQGYLTISNALQWRLQYGRVIQEAGKVAGIRRIR